LVPSPVDLTGVIDFLNNVEFNLNGLVVRTSTITTYFTSFLIVVLYIRLLAIWQLYIRNLKVVLSAVICVCAYEEAMFRKSAIW